MVPVSEILARLKPCTHNSVHDRVLAEQDNFARRADEPLALALVVRELLDGPADGRVLTVHERTDVMDLVRVGGGRNGAPLEERALEVVKQVRRVLDTNTQADKVFRQAALGTRRGIDRSMSTNSATMKIGRTSRKRRDTYDMTQGMLMSELTAPKLTLMPQSRVAPTMRSLRVLSPVVKLSTAP